VYQTLVGKPEIKSQLGHPSIHDGKAKKLILDKYGLEREVYSTQDRDQ
jgi:hypothetical protein